MIRLLLLSVFFSLLVRAQDQETMLGILANPRDVEQAIQDLDADGKCLCLAFASQLLVQRGDLESAERLLTKAVAIAREEEARNPSLMGRCSFMQGVLAEARGDLEQARDFFGRAAVSLAKTRQYEGLLDAGTRKAVVEEKQGRLPAALETLAFLQEEGIAGNNQRVLGEASAQKARLHSILHQLPEARQAFIIANSILGPKGTPEEIARLDTIEARILGMEGSFSESVELYEKSFKFYIHDRKPAEAANCRFNAALILGGQGELDESNKLLGEATFYYAQGGSATGVANAIGSQGVNYLAMKNFPVARILLLQAVAMHELGGNMMRAAESQIILGSLNRQIGNVDESEDYLERAMEFFKKCGLEEEGKRRCEAVRALVPPAGSEPDDP